jgi:hypothetical protein
MRSLRPSLLLLVPLLAAAAEPPAPDYSSPEKTWAAVCAALKAEDLPAFRACFYSSSEMSRLFMASYADLTVTTFRLANAIELVPNGKAASEKLKAVYSDLVRSGENRKTEITGLAQDQARWSRTIKTDSGDRTEVMYFKKIDGKWLIDTESSYALDSAAGRKAAENFLENAKVQLPRLKKVIEDIQANRIKSLEELSRRLNE